MQNYDLAVSNGMLAKTSVYTCFLVVFYSSQNIQKKMNRMNIHKVWLPFKDENQEQAN